VIHNDPPIVSETPLQSNLITLVPENDSRIKQKLIRQRLKNSKKPINLADALKVKKLAPKGYKEDILQIALAKHLDDLQWHKGGFLWFHVPNGGKRTKSQGDKFRKMGLKSGVPDVCVVLPGQKVIWIELKAIWGSLEDEQKKFRDTVTALDHKFYVVKGAHPIDIAQQASAILRENGVVV